MDQSWAGPVPPSDRQDRADLLFMGRESNFKLVEVSGSQFDDHLELLAGLRIAVFREWPYLYEGAMDYEKRYLGTYARSDRSYGCLVYSGDSLVGATTAILASDAEEAFQIPIRERNIPPQQVCYFGESILLPGYRGLGLGREFMDRRLGFARSVPEVEWAAFCAVQRPDSHPRRPLIYRNLDDFWESAGFARIEGMVTTYTWKDVDALEPAAKIMQFWMRRL